MISVMTLILILYFYLTGFTFLILFDVLEYLDDVLEYLDFIVDNKILTAKLL